MNAECKCKLRIMRISWLTCPSSLPRSSADCPIQSIALPPAKGSPSSEPWPTRRGCRGSVQEPLRARIASAGNGSNLRSIESNPSKACAKLPVRLLVDAAPLPRADPRAFLLVCRIKPQSVGWAKARRASRVVTCPPAASSRRCSVGPVASHFQKTALHFYEIMFYSRVSRPIEKGRSARSSRHAGRGAMAVVLPQRAWHVDERQRADVKSQRAGTPTLVLRSRRRLRAAWAMVAKKPGAPGRLRINVKTVAQGRPGDLGCTCGTCRLHSC
ncbi:hypothetical protein ACVILH_005940 [Bradyrhizobium sp. USDA 4353]